MTQTQPQTVTAFEGDRTLAAGPLTSVAETVRATLRDRPAAAILVFNAETGRVIDIDLRGPQEPAPVPAQPSPGRGRPKLGVKAREVTLLPRHWDWLAEQPGGASATLRRLVDDARRRDDPRAERRKAQDAAYRFLQAMAGDRPGYEDALRALYADDRAGFEAAMADWPQDIADFARRLAHADGAN